MALGCCRKRHWRLQTRLQFLPRRFDLECLARCQTQRERLHLIQAQKDQWLRLFEAETQASLLHPTLSKKVIRQGPSKRQRTEICLSISQEPAQSTLALRCSQRLCRRFPALSSDTGQNGQGILLNLCPRINRGSV